MQNKEENKVTKTYRDSVVDTMLKRAEACKKIKSDEKEIKGLVTKLFNYIDYFNRIEPYKTILFDFMPLSEIKILPEFAPFVYPKSVRLIPGNIQSTDLLVRPNSNGVSDSNADYQDYLNTMIKWRNLFKKDISDAISLESLKTEKSFSDILNRAGYCDEDGKIYVRFDSTPFIPIPIIGELDRFFEDGYLNSDYLDVVSYYLKTLLF